MIENHVIRHASELRREIWPLFWEKSDKKNDSILTRCICLEHTCSVFITIWKNKVQRSILFVVGNDSKKGYDFYRITACNFSNCRKRFFILRELKDYISQLLTKI